MDFDLEEFLDLDTALTNALGDSPDCIDVGSPGPPNVNLSQSWNELTMPQASWSQSPKVLPDQLYLSTLFGRHDGNEGISLPAVEAWTDREADESGHVERLSSLPPNLDMSSALALISSLKDPEKRTSYLAFDHEQPIDHLAKKRKSDIVSPGYLPEEAACTPPPRLLKDELVALYFRHIHPLCPVIDEFEFTELYYSKLNETDEIKRADLPLFQAMMFAASLHLSEVQLRTTPYSTLHEGQSALFDKAKTLYRLRYTLDELALTKVALLLSYWSPYNSDSQVNSYWVDRAFQHARGIQLSDPERDSGAMCCRRRIVWWCCLIRDRLTSFGLRRPYRLHEAGLGWKAVTETDFGLEAIFPKYVSVKSKRNMILAFLWLCKLSEIVSRMAVFQEDSRFEREWSDNVKDRAEIRRELHQVSVFDAQLKECRKEHQKGSEEAIKDSQLGTSKMPFYMLQVLNDSFVAALYQPYINCPAPSNSLMEKFQKVALRRIKQASSAVALHIREIVSNTKIEDIPQTIVAWVTFPAVVYLVASDSSISDETSRENSLNYLSVLMAFFSALKSRFHSVLFLTHVMKEASDLIAGKKRELGLTSTENEGRDSNTITNEHSASPTRSPDSNEAEVLEIVANLLDMSLANDGKPYQPVGASFAS